MQPLTTADRLSARLGDVLGDAPGVLVAYLFGSRATGRPRADSDLDVAVLLDSPRADPPRLGADLQQAVAPLRVDLVVLNGAPVTLAYRVLRDGRLVQCRDDAARSAFWVDTVDRYLDMAPTRRILAAGTRRRMREGRFGRS